MSSYLCVTILDDQTFDPTVCLRKNMFPYPADRIMKWDIRYQVESVYEVKKFLVWFYC
jgi:hypothetical protein